MASMPFLDRQEMVAVSGWSRAAVYEAVEKLEAAGSCASVLTAAGLSRLADEEDRPLEALLRSRPVSAQWRRNLMERLDALAVIYRMASLLSGVAYPIRFHWYRASPLDAAVTLPDGKTVGIVRQGLTADRSGFAKRLWRLRDGPMPGALLVLMADAVRLRHARRLLSTTEAPAFFALEREAVLAGADDPIWRPLKVSAAVDLRYVLDRTDPGGALPVEDKARLASIPDDIRGRGAAAEDIADHMLPLFVRSAEKRALDLISDWPSPTGASPSSPAGTTPRSAWRNGGGASPSKTGIAPLSGATSPAEGTASCSGTSSTPPPSTASWPRSPRRTSRHFRHDDRMRAVNIFEEVRRPLSQGLLPGMVKWTPSSGQR